MDLDKTQEIQEGIVEKLDKLNALNKKIAINQAKLKFAMKYQNGLWKVGPFWLAPIPSRKLKPQFDEYIKDYCAAFGHEPSWITGSKLYDLQNFKLSMRKMYHKYSGN